MQRSLLGDREPICAEKSPAATRGGRTLRRFAASLCLATLLFATAAAQVTITAADVGATLSLGSSITGRIDTTKKTVNIGSPGATSWDFSNLVTISTATLKSVRPDTTQFYSLFPGSTHALRGGTGGGILYQYFKLGTDLLNPGSGTQGSFQITIRNLPDAITYQLPMTFGTSWTSNYIDSSLVILPPPLPPAVTTTNHSITYTVDAYGPLTLPGGGVHDALRLRGDQRNISKGGSTHIIIYVILARDGASVTITAADTMQPNSGTINAAGVSWSGSSATDVPLSEALPSGFALMQNYPNPFNPSTNIQFNLAHSSFVRLVVVNVLGEEIATLVSKELPSGSYQETFNAVNLPAGMYFYKLQTSQVSIVKKMLLLR